MHLARSHFCSSIIKPSLNKEKISLFSHNLLKLYFSQVGPVVLALKQATTQKVIEYLTIYQIVPRSCQSRLEGS